MFNGDLLKFQPGSASRELTIAAQAELVSLRFLPPALGGDGEWGEGSTRAFAGLTAATSGDAVAIAVSQIGAKELPDHNNDGPIVNLYLGQCGLAGDNAAWCACFVSWVLARWAQNTARKPEFAIPSTPAAWGFEQFDGKDGAKVFHPQRDKTLLKRGDIVMYTFSHVGILLEQAGDVLHVIEGNTNSDGSRDGYEVIQHPRYLSNVRSVLRLPW